MITDNLTIKATERFTSSTRNRTRRAGALLAAIGYGQRLREYR